MNVLFSFYIILFNPRCFLAKRVLWIEHLIKEGKTQNNQKHKKLVKVLLFIIVHDNCWGNITKNKIFSELTSPLPKGNREKEKENSILKKH